MSVRYVCWGGDDEKDPGADPPEEHVVEHCSIEWAAEDYAERMYGNGDQFEAITIMVRDGNGVVHAVDVCVEYEPTFSGWVKS